MTTSSSDRNRCTRISPSAVLDDRLDGKDLEWARDHLRRCEACRERVEDFREMMMRVGRLPSAVIGAAAMDDAFALSIPERMRGQADTPPNFQLAPPPEVAPAIPAFTDLAPPVRPEVTSVPDLLGDLEREIFRDEPGPDHPTPLAPIAEPIFPTLAAPPDAEVQRAQPEAEPDEDIVDPPIGFPGALAGEWREVPVDSHREPDHEQRGAIEPDPAVASPESTIESPRAASEGAEPQVEEAAKAAPADDDEKPAASAPSRKADGAMRIAVGLGAAACVLLAALLYEGGWLSRGVQRLGSTAPAATATLTSPTASRPAASASPSPITTAAAAPVLYSLGNGIAGGTVYRIRPGTAIAGYTRLVFDIRGGGLPAMVISRPDELHVAVTFKQTSGASLPVKGIRSYHVAAIEPAVQQGPDATVTVDLARSVRVTAFTLPATAGYAWRLVVDLHTS